MDASAAISQHGAVAVYAAAHRHAAGDKARGLATVGIYPKTMGDVWDIMRAAHEAMTDAERAIEAASASSAMESKG